MSNLVANPFSELLLENPFWDLVFKPELHPRWPKGSGKKSGEFIGKGGGSAHVLSSTARAEIERAGLNEWPKKDAGLCP